MKQMKYLITALLAALLLTAAVPVMAAPPSETNGDYKLLALTFDDGPYEYTERLLDGLARLNAKATFFMVGKMIERYPDIPERMVAEGHEIANHSYSHPVLTYDNVSYELEKTRELLVQYGGERDYFVRAPYGSDTASSVFNSPSIFWALNSGDYLTTDYNYVAQYIINIVKDGDIFLLHDTHDSSVTAALILVEELQKQGYEFVTLSELFRRRGVEPQNGVRYSYVRNTGINLGPFDPEYYDESQLNEHWAYEAIKYVLEHELFNGTDEGFLPNKKMTRAMFLTALGHVAGVSSEPLTSVPFSNVPVAHYAAPYIAWAAENWVIDPRSETYDYDGNITREEMAWVIWLYLRYAGLAGETEDVELPYTDAEEISPYFLDGVRCCTALSLMTGDELSFHPKDYTTRAQVAVLFMRLHQFVLAQEQPAFNEGDAELGTGEAEAVG